MSRFADYNIMHDATAARPAYRSPAAWMLLLFVFAGVLALDLGTKAWAFKDVHVTREILLSSPLWVSPIPSKPLLPWGLLDQRLVFNHGAVFGIGSHQRFFFIAFTSAALMAGVFIFGRLTRAGHRLAHAAIALVLAGGMGNLYDRVTLGAVRDFLHMLPNRPLPFEWRWPGGSPEMFPWVFNVADMALLFGMALLLVHMHRIERRRAATAGDSVLAQPQQVSAADTP